MSLQSFWTDDAITVPPRSQGNFVFHGYPQVDRLLTIHNLIGGVNRGRRFNLEVLNKSAIVLTCAYWEAFVEDLTAQAVRHLAEHATSPSDLPVDLRKSILKDLQSTKNELAMWNLAGDQWRALLRDRARKIVSVSDRTLSSPTSRKVDEFFLQQSGMVNVSHAWARRGTSAEKSRQRLDAFIDLRNTIAHRGGPLNRVVLKRQAEDGLRLIDRLIEASTGAVDKQLTAATGVALIETISFSQYAPVEDL
jgi:hypothetical protein